MQIEVSPSCWLICPIGSCLQAAGAADTAIELCVLIRRADVLWGEVYPRYLACGQHPALLERLLPHILASKLPSFPPEVMQVSCMCLCHMTLLQSHGHSMRSSVSCDRGLWFTSGWEATQYTSSNTATMLLLCNACSSLQAVGKPYSAAKWQPVSCAALLRLADSLDSNSSVLCGND